MDYRIELDIDQVKSSQVKSSLFSKITVKFYNEHYMHIAMLFEVCSIQSKLDYPHSLELHEIVRIIENMNINEEQKLITLRKRHLIVEQNICKSFGKQYGLHLHCPL